MDFSLTVEHKHNFINYKYMKSFTNYILSGSNYTIINVNNYFNFLIDVLEISEEKERPHIINSLKLNMGLELYERFKSYIVRKIPNHEIVALFK